MAEDPLKLKKKIRRWLLLFMFLLVMSGLTAIPLEFEISLILPYTHNSIKLLNTIYGALQDTGNKYPFMFYGFDWLAFAHLVIAVAFIGPYRDPVRNIWVIQFGIIACLMVFPLAFIMGPIRGIPFYWQLIDCSFGVFGGLLLYRVYKLIKKL